MEVGCEPSGPAGSSSSGAGGQQASGRGAAGSRDTAGAGQGGRTMAAGAGAAHGVRPQQQQQPLPGAAQGARQQQQQPPPPPPPRSVQNPEQTQRIYEWGRCVCVGGGAYRSLRTCVLHEHSTWSRGRSGACPCMRSCAGSGDLWLKGGLGFFSAGAAGLRGVLGFGLLVLLA